MAGSISFHGRKKLSTIQREFTEAFPFLGIKFYNAEEHEESVKGERIRSLDSSKSIAAVRTVKSPEELSVHGRTKVSNLEKNIRKHFGMLPQVLFQKDGSTYYTSGEQDDLGLSELNRLVEERGCKEFSY